MSEDRHPWVEVRSPATTANIGPAFDCLGLALNLENRFFFGLPEDGGLLIRSHGPVDVEFPSERSNAAVQAFDAGCRMLDVEPPENLELTIDVRLPLASGLGSSATARVAGLVAARALYDDSGRLADDELARAAAVLEGHPDNAVACMLGGLVAGYQGEESWDFLRIPVERFPSLALCVPDNIHTATDAARDQLPAQVPLADAAFGIGRTALLITALTTDNWDILPIALDDRLHESVRGVSIPGWDQLRGLAVAAGAYGITISGSGPAVFIMAPNNQSAEAAGKAILERWSQDGVRAELHLPTVNLRGAVVA